jgi:hypothetical protein
MHATITSRAMYSKARSNVRSKDATKDAWGDMVNYATKHPVYRRHGVQKVRVQKICVQRRQLHKFFSENLLPKCQPHTPCRILSTTRFFKGRPLPRHADASSSRSCPTSPATMRAQSWPWSVGGKLRLRCACTASHCDAVQCHASRCHAASHAHRVVMHRARCKPFSRVVRCDAWRVRGDCDAVERRFTRHHALDILPVYRYTMVNT